MAELEDVGGEGKSAKGKGDTLWGGAFFTYGLGPHFSWLIAGESESLVYSLCDILCFCVIVSRKSGNM